MQANEHIADANPPDADGHGGWCVGIDGCKGGWFYVASRPGSAGDLQIDVGVISHVAELPSDLARVCMDIPIGLYDTGEQARVCDTLARKALSPRGSTVFAAPVRPCLAAKTYPEACAISVEHTGKRLSKQAFFIFNKIQQVDLWLAAHPRYRGVVHEVHPELAFCMLNGGVPVLSKKKDATGLAERLALLTRVYPEARKLYTQALAAYPRGVLARDDIVDALVCWCVATAPPEQRKTLPEDPPHDSQGLAMAMCYREW